MVKQEVFSEVPKMAGAYQVETPLNPPICNQTVFGIGSFCSVRHNRNNIIDSESKLKGLDHILDNWKPPDNIVKELEPNTEIANNPLDITLKNFEPIGTRGRKSCKTVSEKAFNRFDFPFYEPEANTIYAEDIRGGVHSRIEAKDSYECQFR